MKRLLFLCSVLLFFACVKREESRSIDDRIVSVSFSDENTMSLNDSLHCEFIPLEIIPDNSNLIGHILKIEIVDDRIFVLDMLRSKSLQVYDMQGKYMAHVGAVGNGPGEYITPHDFYLDKEEKGITITDLSTNTRLFYDLDTYQYKGEQKIPFNSGVSIKHNNRLVWCDFNGFKKARDLYYIKVTDATMENEKYLYPADFTSPYGIHLGDALYQIDGKIHFTHP
ncbi:MAG: 6-bladed beta-propeller, partial [Tannerellaceae bacterium]|nr:6-bladed beta-propeller [Tannerellaceae bacterium]